MKGLAQVELTIGLIVVALVGVGVWRLYSYAYSEGEKEAELVVARRDNSNLIKAQAEIKRLTDQARALEDQHIVEVAVIDTNAQEALRRVQVAKDRFISNVVAGRIVLLDANARCAGGRTGSTSALASAPSVGDGARGAELSKELGGFLLGEAARADKVVVKLDTCQKLLAARSE